MLWTDWESQGCGFGESNAEGVIDKAVLTGRKVWMGFRKVD